MVEVVYLSGVLCVAVRTLSALVFDSLDFSVNPSLLLSFQ